MTISNRPRLAKRLITAAVSRGAHPLDAGDRGGHRAAIAAAVVPPVINTSSDQVSADPLPDRADQRCRVGPGDRRQHGLRRRPVHQARPAGSPPGTNETPRSNVLAYNLTTGALLPGFVANTNSQVKTVTAVAGRLAHLHRRPVHPGQRRQPLPHRRPQPDHGRGRSPASTPSPTAPSTTSSSPATPCTPAASSPARAAAPPAPSLAAFTPPTAPCSTWAPTADATVQTMVMGPDGIPALRRRQLHYHQRPQRATAWARSTRSTAPSSRGPPTR